jgi:hypothetical protein
VELASCVLAKANPAAGFSCRRDIARAFPLVVFVALPVAASSSVAQLHFSHSFFCGRAAQDPLSHSDPRGQASGQISQRSSHGL